MKMKNVTISLLMGNTIGMVLGPISMLSINARDYIRSNEPWPDINYQYFCSLMITSIPSGINSVLCVWAAIAYHDTSRKTVLLFPVGLHLVVAALTAIANPRKILDIQFYVLIITVVMFASGRLGQHFTKNFFLSNLESKNNNETGTDS